MTDWERLPREQNRVLPDSRQPLPIKFAERKLDTNDKTPRWLPHNIEAEQALLGAILINNDAMAMVSDFLKKEHFFEPIHAEMFEIMERLISMGKAVTPISIMTFLPDGLISEHMSIRQYVARIAAEATTIINARDYAMDIRELSFHRRLMDIGAQLERQVPQDIGQLSQEAIDAIDDVIAESTTSQERPVELKGALATAITESAKAFERNGEVLGLSWGLTGLDTKTLGLHPGELIVAAGRPGMGKTAVLLSVARSLGRAGHPGVIFSIEMGATSLAQRLISDELWDNGPIAYQDIRAGKFSEQQFGRITEAAKRLSDLPVHIETRGSLTVSQIASKARRRQRRYGLKWIAIDYLQLIKPSSNYHGRRDLEIGEITSSLKRLAKELQIPVILLSQLNRGVESREDKRPSMADLRESGNIEQDADVILMLYREAYYLERTMPKEQRQDSEEFVSWSLRLNKVKNQLDIIIEKQRQGPIGTVRVFCDIASNAVRDLADTNYGERL